MVWGVKDPFFCWMINWECQYWSTRDGGYYLSWKYLGILLSYTIFQLDISTIYINDYASLSQFCHVAYF